MVNWITLEDFHPPLPWANPPRTINLPYLPTTTAPAQITPSAPSPLSDRPEHYNTSIDPYAYALANDMGPLEMNILKYITRWKKKGGIDDLKKARNTLQRLIGHVEGEINRRIGEKRAEHGICA